MTPAQQQSWMPFGTPYDYFSIMHFYPYAFTKNKEPTITPKNKKVSITLQRKSLTVIWILTITFYRFLNLNDRDKSQLRWSVRTLKARKLPSLPPEKIVKYCCPETPFYCSKTTAISVGNMIPINWPSFFCLFSIYLKKQERNNGQTRDLFYRRTRLSRETKFHARAFKKKKKTSWDFLQKHQADREGKIPVMSGFTSSVAEECSKPSFYLTESLAVQTSGHGNVIPLHKCQKTFRGWFIWVRIHVLQVSLRYIGQRDFISHLDLQRVNLMYNCPGSESITDSW